MRELIVLWRKLKSTIEEIILQNNNQSNVSPLRNTNLIAQNGQDISGRSEVQERNQQNSISISKKYRDKKKMIKTINLEPRQILPHPENNENDRRKIHLEDLPSERDQKFKNKSQNDSRMTSKILIDSKLSTDLLPLGLRFCMFYKFIPLSISKLKTYRILIYLNSYPCEFTKIIFNKLILMKFVQYKAKTIFLYIRNNIFKLFYDILMYSSL